MLINITHKKCLRINYFIDKTSILIKNEEKTKTV